MTLYTPWEGKRMLVFKWMLTSLIHRHDFIDGDDFDRYAYKVVQTETPRPIKKGHIANSLTDQQCAHGLNNS